MCNVIPCHAIMSNFLQDLSISPDNSSVSMIEIDEDDEIVWECSAEQLSELMGYTARAKKYSLSYISDLEGDIYFDNSINIQPHFQKCLKNPESLKVSR